MVGFDEQPAHFETNLKLINHLKTFPDLDFETLHPLQFPVRLYDPVLIKVLGLNGQNATRDSVNTEMNRILAVVDRHLSARARNDEDLMPHFRSFMAELRDQPGKKPNMNAIFNLILGLSQVRYRYWHTHPQEVAETVLECNIDLAVLEIVLAFRILRLNPGRQPARLSTTEGIQEFVNQTRQRRDELMAAASGPSETSIAPQRHVEAAGPATAGPSNAGPSATEPFTKEDNEVVFQNPELNDMIQDLGVMLGHPGGGNASS